MPSSIRHILSKIYHAFHVFKWRLEGNPVPPNSYVKRVLVRKAFKKSSCNCFVETGTLHGRMIEALFPLAAKIFSIELSDAYYKKVEEKFKTFPKVNLIKGDSGEKLNEVLAQINESTFFWLDAHFSDGDTAQANLNTPIIQELRAIQGHSVDEHIIWIDDARCFDGTEDYPTLETIKRIMPSYNMVVKDDIIRLS